MTCENRIWSLSIWIVVSMSDFFLQWIHFIDPVDTDVSGSFPRYSSSATASPPPPSMRESTWYLLRFGGSSCWRWAFRRRWSSAHKLYQCPCWERSARKYKRTYFQPVSTTQHNFLLMNPFIKNTVRHNTGFLCVTNRDGRAASPPAPPLFVCLV